LQKKQGRVYRPLTRSHPGGNRAPHRPGLAAVAPAPSVAAGGNGPLPLKAFNPRLQPFLQICKNGLLNSRENDPGQRFLDEAVSFYPPVYDERLAAMV